MPRRKHNKPLVGGYPVSGYNADPADEQVPVVNGMLEKQLSTGGTVVCSVGSIEILATSQYRVVARRKILPVGEHA